VWSGPLCTRVLADLGADVIKVEPPFVWNVAAQGAAEGRPVAGPGKLGRNKRSVSVDLRVEAGRELLRRLVARVDVLAENFSARVMPNFGLGYEALREVNRGLVYLAMSGYGTTGPYREYLAYGSATEAMTGLTVLLGYPDEEPLNSAIAYPDPVAGLTGASAVLTALVQQARTGAGCFLDLSQVEPASIVLGEFFLAAQIAGRAPARSGNRHPLWAPHGTYRCRGEDEWVSIAIRSDEEWHALCRVMGLADLADDATIATADGRRAHSGPDGGAVPAVNRMSRASRQGATSCGFLGALATEAYGSAWNSDARHSMRTMSWAAATARWAARRRPTSRKPARR
jgi:crotonobetainyl-CoA:carnitine CoA-transferase CaiB-like acyl-CoA transferase